MDSPQYREDLSGLWTFYFILTIKETFSNWWLTHLRRISSGDIFIRSSRVSPGLRRFTRPGTWLIFYYFFFIFFIIFSFIYLMVICLKRYILISCHTRPRTSHFLPWLWSRLSLKLQNSFVFTWSLKCDCQYQWPHTLWPLQSWWQVWGSHVAVIKGNTFYLAWWRRKNTLNIPSFGPLLMTRSSIVSAAARLIILQRMIPSSIFSYMSLPVSWDHSLISNASTYISHVER